MNPKIGFDIDRDQIPAGSDEFEITVELDLTAPAEPDQLPLNSPPPEGSEA